MCLIRVSQVKGSVQARGGTIGNGTVFKITSQGMLTTLYNFDGTDGDLPTGLVRATDGNFYGTTAAGGGRACSFIDGCGTVFEISASGAFRTLYIFHRSHSPPAPPIQDTRGDFYGTTVGGGSYGDGTIFGLSIGLSPFVKTNPASGTIGAVVYILGTNLVGATSVTFNGTVAAFTVVSASVITTTLPSGATTGTLQVVTPGGTLSSNVPFRVLP